MATIPQVAGVLQTILGPVAERAARATGLVQRASKLVLVEFIVVCVEDYEMSLTTATETVRRWLEEK